MEQGSNRQKTGEVKLLLQFSPGRIACRIDSSDHGSVLIHAGHEAGKHCLHLGQSDAEIAWPDLITVERNVCMHRAQIDNGFNCPRGVKAQHD